MKKYENSLNGLIIYRQTSIIYANRKRLLSKYSVLCTKKIKIALLFKMLMNSFPPEVIFNYGFGSVRALSEGFETCVRSTFKGNLKLGETKSNSYANIAKNMSVSLRERK